MDKKQQTKKAMSKDSVKSDSLIVNPNSGTPSSTTTDYGEDAKRRITEAALITEIGSSATSSVYATTALSNAVVTDFLTKRGRTSQDFSTALEQLQAIHKVSEASINDKWKALDRDL